MPSLYSTSRSRAIGAAMSVLMWLSVALPVSAQRISADHGECRMLQAMPAAGDSTFRQIFSMGVAPDGALFALEAAAERIVVIDGAGSVDRVLALTDIIARPARIGWSDDELYVIDRSGTRAVLLENAGGLKQDVRLDPPTSSGARIRIESLTPGEGVLYQTTMPIDEMFAKPASLLPVLWADRSGTVRDTIVELPALNRGLVVRLPNGSEYQRLQPLSDAPLFAVDPSGEWVVKVDRRVKVEGMEGTFSVKRWTIQGDTLLSRQFPVTWVPIAPEVIDALVGNLLGSTWADSPPAERAMRRALYVPDAYPPVSRVLADRGGAVWLARESVRGETRVRWEIIGPEGQSQGCVLIPRNIQLQVVQSQQAWGLERTTSGRFRIWRLSLPGEGSID